MQGLFDENFLTPSELKKFRTYKTTNALIADSLFGTGDFDAAVLSGNDHIKAAVDCTEFPPFLGSTENDKMLSSIAIGPFTPFEWAQASVPPSFDQHGADLALHYPRVPGRACRQCLGQPIGVEDPSRTWSQTHPRIPRNCPGKHCDGRSKCQADLSQLVTS